MEPLCHVCDYLSMQGLKLIRISEMGSRDFIMMTAWFYYYKFIGGFRL